MGLTSILSSDRSRASAFCSVGETSLCRRSNGTALTTAAASMNPLALTTPVTLRPL
jgi:hypothetical protein